MDFTLTVFLLLGAAARLSAAEDMNKLLYMDGATGAATLVSLDGSTPNCDLPAYPSASHYPSVVTYMQGAGGVVACGGRDLPDSVKCWFFDGSSWTNPIGNSTQHHCYEDSANVQTDQGWWVTGRLQTAYGTCTADWTSEVLTPSGDWIPGPSHPREEVNSYTSCFVGINSTHSLFTGGFPTLFETWIYDWSTGEWSQTGNMNQGRLGHGCVSLGDKGVLVAGGEVYSVELYDPVQGTWTRAETSLPQDIIPEIPVLINWNGAVLALFWGNDKVYKRDESSGEWQVIPGVQLPESYFGSMFDKAVLVPDSFALGCM